MERVGLNYQIGSETTKDELNFENQAQRATFIANRNTVRAHSNQNPEIS